MEQESFSDVKAHLVFGMQERVMHLYFVRTEDGVQKFLFVGLHQLDASFQVTHLNYTVNHFQVNRADKLADIFYDNIYSNNNSL